jgi:hypothetical protein
MARTATTTGKSPKKKPVFFGVNGAKNRYLVGREEALTK